MCIGDGDLRLLRISNGLHAHRIRRCLHAVLRPDLLVLSESPAGRKSLLRRIRDMHSIFIQDRKILKQDAPGTVLIPFDQRMRSHRGAVNILRRLAICQEFYGDALRP